MSDKNVIELDLFREKKGKKTKSTTKAKSAQVVEIGEVRQSIIDAERRKVKRTILTEFIGASVILPGSGLVRVSLNDISKGGLSFDVEKKYGKFKKQEEVAVRFYLNHKTYFPLTIKITNCRFIPELQMYRHGAHFVEGMINEEAVGYFIGFMESVSASLKSDLGDTMLIK